MNLQETLNQEGFRLTHPRQVVIRILEAASTPLSPLAIHQQSIDTQDEIGLVSVYRTLELLTELSLVRRVHGEGDCQGYVLASPGHHHHLVCRQCGKAVEFTGSGDLANLRHRIQHETGFEVEGHLLQLYGLCPNCQKESKAHAQEN